MSKASQTLRERWLALLAWLSPVSSILVAFGHVVVSQFSEEMLWRLLVVGVTSVLLGRFMWRRATRQEASLGPELVSPADEESRREQADFGALIAAALLFGLAALGPLF